MTDQEKTREQLIDEVAQLRRQIVELERSTTDIGDSGGPWRPTDPQWHSLVQNTPVNIVVVDRELRIRFANHSDSGRTLDQALGKHFYDFCRPEYRDTARRCVEDVFRTGKPGLYEAAVLRLDDQQHWYATHVGPIFAEKEVVAVSVTSVNITDRKRAEEALQKVNDELEQRVQERTAELLAANERLQAEVRQRQQSEAQYKALVESCPDSVAMLDTQGRVVFASQRAAEQHGMLDPGEMLGRPITDFVAASERNRARASLGHLSEDKVHRNVEHTLLRKDGTTFDAEISSAVVSDAAGKTVGFAGVFRDITARKQAAEKLKMLGRFVEAATQGFGMADIDGRIIYANPFLARLFGVEKPEELTGTHVSDYYPPDYMRRRETEIIPALRRGESWRGEQNMVFPDGQLHTTIHTVFPVLDDDGKLLYTAAVINEVTELRRAEEALRQSYEELRASEERFQLVVQGAGVGIWDWNIRTGKVYYSPRWKAIFGYAEHEIGEGFEDWARLLHPDERERIIKLQEEFLAGTASTATAEYRLRHSDGSYRWIVAHAVVVRDEHGKACRLVGSHGDITDRKQAEEAVWQSRDQLQSIYDQMIEGLLITDIETKRFVRVNESFCRMLGYSEEELLTLSIKDIHPAQEAPDDLRRFQAAADGRVTINEDRPVLKKDGSIFYADITGRPIFFDERPCLLALFRDVTERKQAEEKLRRERQALRRMVLASDRERRLITYELHDGVAQQLLGAMLLLESQPTPKGKGYREGGEAYRDGINALRHASLELRRMMNWLRTPVLDKFGLADAIEDVAAQLRLTPEAPEIEYVRRVKFKRLEPTLENSVFRIAQEAMTNACRHSKSEKVRVQLIQKGDGVTLEVRDWGTGFDQAAVAENRFGLVGIQERSRIVGGKLSIKSELGKGTVIQVKFPVLEPASP